MSITYNVALQGINQERTEASGDYESQELGQKTVEEIRTLLETYSGLECPAPKHDDDDLCPPSLHCEKDGDVFAFMFDGGTIFSCETDGNVSVEQAVTILSDASELDKLRQCTREENAPPAALKTDVLATDTDKVTASSIDTSSNAPQFSLEVWKSGNARGYTFAPPAIGGFFIFVGLVALKEDTGPAVVCLAVGVACFFLRKFVKPWARETLTIGFDWGTNTLWAKRGKKEPTFQPDANRFVDFTLEKKRSTEEMYHDLDGDGVVESSNVKVVTWVLEGKTSDPNSYGRAIGTFVQKKAGQEALTKLKQLYASQK